MRYGFVIDHNRCIGCHACTVACKQEHNVPLGVNRTWVKYIEKGEYPETKRHFGVLRCNHCDDAPCIEICPTVSLFRRPDGIVDFDSERCIGCKSCMQACPYDALYIDPNTQTAAKCNFCAHRVEVGLKPACEIACPTVAIISGDLDDPTSKVSQIVAAQKVTARKPEKGTRPKLFYVGIDGDLLRPTSMEPQPTHLWADKAPGEDLYALRKDSGRESAAPGSAREVYDVPHPPPWGKKISAYLWTKSIAAGVLMIAALLSALQYDEEYRLLHVASPLIALVFTGVTVFLLVFDLKRPDRFYYLLTKSNPRSWLVIGGYILGGYGFLTILWLAFGVLRDSPPSWVSATSVLLALGTAGYTAFLFAQAKGRDLWQSRLFLWQLLVQALIAGSCALILMGSLLGCSPEVFRLLTKILSAALILSIIIMLGEIFLPHTSEDARRAANLLKRGALSRSFGGLAIGAGAVLPLLLLWSSADALLPRVFASGLALAGVWVFEDLWIKAGQAVPLS